MIFKIATTPYYWTDLPIHKYHHPEDSKIQRIAGVILLLLSVPLTLGIGTAWILRRAKRKCDWIEHRDDEYLNAKIQNLKKAEERRVVFRLVQKGNLESFEKWCEGNEDDAKQCLNDFGVTMLEISLRYNRTQFVPSLLNGAEISQESLLQLLPQTRDRKIGELLMGHCTWEDASVNTLLGKVVESGNREMISFLLDEAVSKGILISPIILFSTLFDGSKNRINKQKGKDSPSFSKLLNELSRCLENFKLLVKKLDNKLCSIQEIIDFFSSLDPFFRPKCKGFFQSALENRAKKLLDAIGEVSKEEDFKRLNEYAEDCKGYLICKLFHKLGLIDKSKVKNAFLRSVIVHGSKEEFLANKKLFESGRGGDLTHKYEENKTLLHLYIRDGESNDNDILEFLLNKINPNLKDNSRDTALHSLFALFTEAPLQFISTFLNHPDLNPNILDRERCSVFHRACSKASSLEKLEDQKRLLEPFFELKIRPDLTLKNGSDQTPLDLLENDELKKIVEDRLKK